MLNRKGSKITFVLPLDTGPVSVVGDFNDDHKTDVALTGPKSWGSIPVAFSNGDGSFTVTNFGAPDFPAQPVSPALGTAIALSTAGVLVLGVLPNLLVQYAPVSTLVAGP